MGAALRRLAGVPADYDPGAFPPFAVTADLVILAVRPPAVEVLVVRRAEAPFAGAWALPGGFVGPEQSPVAAAQDKLRDKAGVAVEEAHLEQLATFGEPGRDPRMRVVSVAYLAMVAEPAVPSPGRDTREAAWMDVAAVDRGALAFDHDEILDAGLERVRAKLEYTTLATKFCGPTFTMAELRGVYEAVWNTELDPPNFNRKVLACDGFVEPTGETVSVGRGRPAKTYRAGSGRLLDLAIRRG